MYKFKSTGKEADHQCWEWVAPEEQCESCGQTNRECECSTHSYDDPDEPPDVKRRF